MFYKLGFDVAKLHKLHKLLNDNHVFDLELYEFGKFTQINKHDLGLLLIDNLADKTIIELYDNLKNLRTQGKFINCKIAHITPRYGVYDTIIHFDNTEYKYWSMDDLYICALRTDINNANYNNYFVKQEEKLNTIKPFKKLKVKNRAGVFYLAYVTTLSDFLKNNYKDLLKNQIEKCYFITRSVSDKVNIKITDGYLNRIPKNKHNDLIEVKINLQKLQSAVDSRVEYKNVVKIDKETENEYIELEKYVKSFYDVITPLSNFVEWKFIDSLPERIKPETEIKPKMQKAKIKPQIKDKFMKEQKQTTAIVKYVPEVEVTPEGYEVIQLSNNLHVDTAGKLTIKTTGKKLNTQTAKYKPALKHEFVKLCKKHKLDVYTTLGKLYAVSNILNFEKIKLSVESDSNIYNDLLNSIVLQQDVTSPDLIYEFLEQITEFVIDVDVTAFTSNNLDKLTNLMIRYNILCHFNPILQKQFTSRKFLSKHKINQNEVEKVMLSTLDTIAYQSEYYFV